MDVLFLMKSCVALAALHGFNETELQVSQPATRRPVHWDAFFLSPVLLSICLQ